VLRACRRLLRPGGRLGFYTIVESLAETELYAEQLALLEPPGAFEERQADRRSMLASIHAGLLRRALVLARTRGRGPMARG